LGNISKLHQDDWRNKKYFNSRRKVDSESAATTSGGSLCQMSGAATAKARLPTVDSFTCGKKNSDINWRVSSRHQDGILLNTVSQ